LLTAKASSQTSLREVISMRSVGIASLKGDLHGEHWEVLRSILPLYQAITTVIIDNGQQDGRLVRR
jgi:hypothetical protein